VEKTIKKLAKTCWKYQTKPSVMRQHKSTPMIVLPPGKCNQKI